MKLGSFAGLMLLVPAVAAASPIDGRWTLSKDGCAIAESDDSAGPFTFADDKMTFFESECVLKEIAPIGDAGIAWRAKAACSGEGEEWMTDWVLGMDKDGDGKVVHLVQVDMTDGFTTVYYPCE